MKNLIVSLFALLALGCHQSNYPVHAWKQQDASGDWIWYYIMFSSINSNSCPCYSYSSPAPVSNFSSVTFEKSAAMPADLNPATAQAEPVVEVPTEELPPEVAEVWSESFDANDGHETNEPSEGFDESPASESGSSDAGSSDGGGSGGE